jgi:hypothetical protein
MTKSKRLHPSHERLAARARRWIPHPTAVPLQTPPSSGYEAQLRSAAVIAPLVQKMPSYAVTPCIEAASMRCLTLPSASLNAPDCTRMDWQRNLVAGLAARRLVFVF